MKKLKGAVKSKTVWFNSVMIFLWSLFEVTKEFLPELQQYLPENVYKWVGLIVVIINIYLRTKTVASLCKK